MRLSARARAAGWLVRDALVAAVRGAAHLHASRAWISIRGDAVPHDMAAFACEVVAQLSAAPNERNAGIGFAGLVGLVEPYSTSELARD